MIRRALTIAAIAAGVLLTMPIAADAHAVLRSSDPASGASLSAAPADVTLTFSEDPDPTLSLIRVLDTQGREFSSGAPHLAAGARAALRETLNPLSQGVYTVTWRVLSRVDGHLTGGAFAFGVGVSPTDVAAVVPPPSATSIPGPSAIAVLARFAFLAGVVLVIGAAVVRMFVIATVPIGLVWGGVLSALSGAIGIALVQRASAGIGVRAFVASSLGHRAETRIAPLLIALLVLLARRRVRALSFPAVGALAVLAALAHVASGHAGGGTAPGPAVAIQLAHVLAVGAWIGGLAALLFAIRGEADEQRGRAVSRFSSIALVSVFIVIGSGTLRALNEIAAWHEFWTTSYGRVVLIKIALLGVLLTLGAVNRYRNVAAARTLITRPLVRVSRVEIAVGAVVLAVTGLLGGLVPASAQQTKVVAQPTAAVAEGTDFGQTTRARLEVTPGTAGPNQFRLALDPIARPPSTKIVSVSLRFHPPARADIETSTLSLTQNIQGYYVGDGSQFAVDGTWDVIVLVIYAADSIEIPLTFDVRPPADTEQITTIPVPGQPTLYNVTLSAGRAVQFYVDPGKAGANEVHATFFLNGGQFDGLTDITLRGTPVGGAARALPVRVLSPGHFVADATLAATRWRFDVDARAPDGSRLTAYFNETIKP